MVSNLTELREALRHTREEDSQANLRVCLPTAHALVELADEPFAHQLTEV
jgi:hypothetical protein